MKKTILRIAVVFGAVLALSTGCKKDARVLTTQDPNDIDNMVAQVDPMTTEEASADETNGEITMINDGVNENMLVIADDIDAPEGPAGGGPDSSEVRRHIRAKSFIFCLRKVDLDKDQIAKIKKALVSYEDCKGDAVKRARAIYAKLKEAYKEKMMRLQAAYKNGKITEKEYQQGIKDLRIGFAKELRSLHLQDKIDEAFKHCMRELLGNIKRILNDRQWAAFVQCHKK